MPSLKLTYEPDNDGTGRLDAVVQTGFLTAGAHGCSSVSDINRFLDALAVFPITEEAAPQFGIGFWDSSGKLNQCHVCITFRPYGHRGQVMVLVNLASSIYRDEDISHQETAKGVFLVDYADIDQFVLQARRFNDTTIAEAVLGGYEL